jgi:hypothetical protein
VAASVYQVTVPTSGTAAAFICAVPPGTTVILSTTSSNADVFLGMNTAVTSAIGAPLDPTGPTTIVNPPNASTFSLYGVAGTGTHVVGVVSVTAR